MRLFATTVNCFFAEQKSRYPLSDDIYQVLAGKPHERHSPVAEGHVRLKLVKERTGIRWDPTMYGIIVQKTCDFARYGEILVGYSERINKAVPIGRLDRRILFTYWMIPAEGYDFASLEAKYREIMLAPSDIAGLASDSSVIVDIPAEGLVLHHQSGAMTVDQLQREYLVFDESQLPKVIIFLEVSIIDKKAVEYSAEELKFFISRGFELCKSHSDMFYNIWKEVL